jgi:hypothetical protein
MALSLYNRRVSSIDVERAILLGAVRKYTVIAQNGRGTAISGLHYFTSLFEEVQREILPQYWKYVAQKVKTLEQAWKGFNLPRNETIMRRRFTLQARRKGRDEPMMNRPNPPT